MAASKIIRVVMADDHRMFLDGLRWLFESEADINVVATASNGEGALTEVRKHRPDILLLDIDMPDMDGFAVADRLAGSEPDTRIVLLTIHNELPYLLSASREDIQGFVLKDAAFDDLVEAIRCVHAGERYVSPSLEIPSPGEASLSPRENQVLDCAARGLTTDETARHLGIGTKTVETHRAHIIRKLGVHNMTEAVHVAARSTV